MMQVAAAAGGRRLHCGWIIVGITFLALLTTATISVALGVRMAISAWWPGSPRR